VLPSKQIDFASKQHFLVCAQSSAVLTAPVRLIEMGEPAPRAAKTISAFLNRRERFIPHLPVHGSGFGIHSNVGRQSPSPPN
jgi:hypothetical protein